jgi:hypothetical protein
MKTQDIDEPGTIHVTGPENLVCWHCCTSRPERSRGITARNLRVPEAIGNAQETLDTLV